MTQRKRPGATAKRERQRRAEERKSAPILAKRREIEQAIAETKKRLTEMDDAIFVFTSDKAKRAKLEIHLLVLQRRLNALIRLT